MCDPKQIPSNAFVHENKTENYFDVWRAISKQATISAFSTTAQQLCVSTHIHVDKYEQGVFAGNTLILSGKQHKQYST